MDQKGQTEEPNKQGQIIQDVSNMVPKTENFEDPLGQTSFSGEQSQGFLVNLHALTSGKFMQLYTFWEVTQKF